MQKPKQRHDIYYCTVCNVDVGVTLDKDPTKFVKFSAYYRNYQRMCKAYRAAAAHTAVAAVAERFPEQHSSAGPVAFRSTRQRS